MSTKFSLKYRNFLPILGIILLGIIITFLWFRKGLVYGGGEEGAPFYNLTKYQEIISHTWHDAEGGFQLFIPLSKVIFFQIFEFLFRFGINTSLLQAIAFLLLILIGTISVFFLMKETLDDIKDTKKYLISFFAAVFYLLNPYSMTQIWGRGLYVQFFIFALTPAFILFFVMGLRRKKLTYGVFALLISLFLSGAYGFPGNAMSLWLIALLYFCFHLIIFCKSKKDYYFSFIFLTFTFLGWIATNAFWIAPQALSFNQQFSNFGSTENNLASLQGVSSQFPLTLLIRLMQRFYFYSDMYGDFYKTIPSQIISWIIPVISLFSIPKFKKLKSYKFYLTLFLIALFINLGSNFPFGGVFEFFFKQISLLHIFRNPYEKLGIVLLLAYTPFFAIGIYEIFDKVSKKFSRKNAYIVLISLMVLVHGIFLWPMWTGYFAGGLTFNAWMKVPTYYKEADMWIKNQSPYSRILQLPIGAGDGIKFDWDNPYIGIEPGEYFFTNPSVGKNIGFNKAFYNELAKRFEVFQPNISGPDPDLSKSEFVSKSLSEELKKLGVKYIVLHNDVITKYSGMADVQRTVSILTKEGIKKVQTFGQLDIYEVPGKDLGILYSPQVDISFTKINPALYKIKITNTQPSINLNFLDMYDPDLEVYVDNQKIDTHFKLFSYANSWKIDKAGNYEVVLKYKPEDYSELGKKVSLYSVLIVISMGIVFYIYEKRS